MAHLVKFNIPTFAFPPATDGDASPASTSMTSAPLIDEDTVDQDDALAAEFSKQPKIVLACSSAIHHPLVQYKEQGKPNVQVPETFSKHVSSL